MSVIHCYIRLIIGLAGIVFAYPCFAAADAIEVVKAEGLVTSSDLSGKKPKGVYAKSILPAANVLTTGANGRAVVKLGDIGYFVIANNSQIEIDRRKDHAGLLRQVTGMIYYAVNTIKGNQRRLEVRIPTATLGIRGTRFLVVDVQGRREVGMRKGVLNVASPDGDFEIHRQAEQGEFEAFQQEGRDAVAKEQQAFEEFKANTEREFVEFKHDFNLGANRMASFNGLQVEDKPLSAESENDMKTIETYAAKWLNKVQD